MKLTVNWRDFGIIRETWSFREGILRWDAGKTIVQTGSSRLCKKEIR
ncbi:hypothetical protein J2S19_000771 [Metabacillus malikii]|uniref:Uncharacterized protein n=1 Tax=Metabacillus malikii TaxID=1504265 RepID=A0ABT9ZE42_9BACI|nr:hypothetical protein [Metabacillus malikii]